MAPLQLLLLILALLSLEGADAHGTVTKPAMRYNPSVTFQCTCRRLLRNFIRCLQRLVTTDPLIRCVAEGEVLSVVSGLADQLRPGPRKMCSSYSMLGWYSRLSDFETVLWQVEKSSWPRRKTMDRWQRGGADSKLHSYLVSR